MELTPYLNFAGTCHQAFTWYAEVLGGTITASVPFPDAGSRLMHCRLEAGDAVLEGADSLPDPVLMQAMWVSLVVDTAEDAERIFQALADGGQVRMPLGPAFFAARFGMCVDRFGVPWQVTCVQDHS